MNQNNKPHSLAILKNDIKEINKLIKENERYLNTARIAAKPNIANIFIKRLNLGIEEKEINNKIYEHYNNSFLETNSIKKREAPIKLKRLNAYLKAFQAELERQQAKKAELKAQKLSTLRQKLQSSSSSSLPINTPSFIAAYLNRKISPPKK
jgi:hypothetical protein